MWLPRPLYEAKPYLSAAVGVACLLVAWLVERSPRSTLLVLGGGLVTLGLLLWMKRRDYRSTQSAYDPRAIDE
jgi:drug/metabolite transporter (DMT)-like permease